MRMPFDEVRSPHRYTLRLPQHDSEALLAGLSPLVEGRGYGTEDVKAALGG